MNSSSVLYEMQEIRKMWKDNDFSVPGEVRRRYSELLKLRRERVSQLVKDGRVATGSQSE